jgi:hypothetical protein
MAKSDSRDEYPGFKANPDNLPRDEEIREIFAEYGYESWRDVLVSPDLWANPETGNPEYMRPATYSTPGEAIIDMHERGILVFTKIYMTSDGYWHIYVEDTSP